MLPALLSAALLAGLWLRALGWLALPGSVLLGTALLGSVAAVAMLPSRSSAPGRARSWLLWALLAAACWGALLSPPEAGAPSVERLRGGLARVSLEVERGGCGASGCWSEARLLACEQVEPDSCAAAGTRLAVASAEELPRGARVTALAKLRLRTTFHNPSATSRWPDLRPPLHARIEPGAAPRIDALPALDGALWKARRAIRAALASSLRPPHDGIARALLLGEGAAVERELNDAIRQAAVSHVLAVSGMHVTLLVGTLVALVGSLWLRTPLALHAEARRVGAAVGVALAPLIAGLCGASPSAVRAAWTSTLLYTVLACGLRPCPLAVSACVVAGYAALAPADALHPGFVLSVLATAALLTQVAGSVGVAGAVRQSLRAWLATAVFLLLCFGQTSLVALLANVALLPLGTALVPLAAAHLICVQARVDGLLPSASLFELASSAFLEAARYCAALDPGLALPPLSAGQLLALTALTGCFMLPLGLRSRACVCTCALGLLLGCEWLLRHELAPAELRVTFLDVGQGDAILLEGAGEAALIDGGGSIAGGTNPGAQAIIPLLRAKRISKLSWVMLSHPHPDHYGGLAAVLARFPVAELWDTGQADAEQPGRGAVAELLASARARGTRVRRPDELCGQPLPFAHARLTLLAPCPGFDEALEENDNSFVLRLTHGKRSFLFTGDAEREREQRLSALGRALQSDVLKVGHHGSRTSSNAGFLRAVRPWLAVVSAGRGNRFGHPHPEVVERLAAGAAHVLRTDQVGGVEVYSDGRKLRVRARDPSIALAQ